MKIIKIISKQRISYNYRISNIFVSTDDISKEELLSLLQYNLREDIEYYQEVSFTEDNAYNKLCELMDKKIRNIYYIESGYREYYSEKKYLLLIKNANKSKAYKQAYAILKDKITENELVLLLRDLK